MKSHLLIDQRSLAFSRAIAERLMADPSVIEYARGNIARWLKTCSPGASSALREWLSVLDQGVDAVLALLTDSGERATRLRQSNPFAGLLSNAERNQILLRFESYDKTSA